MLADKNFMCLTFLVFAEICVCGKYSMNAMPDIDSPFGKYDCIRAQSIATVVQGVSDSSHLIGGGHTLDDFRFVVNGYLR